MSAPLVSIGIPAYNRPEGLRQTLACLTAQTYANLEIIISNDCSPHPETEKVGRDFAERDPRVSYHHQESNKGGFFNFGFVLGQAKGEYFMWAADDDAWHPRFVETCVQHLKDHSRHGLVFTRYEIYSPFNQKKVSLNHNIYLQSRHRKALFLLLDETMTHKANMSYGVWRRDVVNRVMSRAKARGLSQEQMGKGFDQAFLLVTLGETEVFQIQETLFTKRYNERVIPGSARQFLSTGWRNLRRAARHPFRYVRDACSDTRNYMDTVKRVYGEPDTPFLPLVFLAKRISYLMLRHIL